MKTMPLFSLYRNALLIFVLMLTATPLLAQEIPVTTNNDEAKALFTEGRTLYDNIRFDEAREVFDQALEQDPDFALAHIYRAITATSDNDFEKHLTKAVERKEEVSDGERLFIESVKANYSDRPMQAIAKLKEATDLYPQDKRLHHLLAIVYQNTGMENEAESQLNNVIALDAEFAPAYNNLGYLYKDAGRYEEAEEAFKNYVRLLPDEANPHDSIADLYTKTGKHDLAIEHYQQALSINPNFYFSQQKIGDNLLFQGLYEDGRTAYKQAIEMAPHTSNKLILHQAMANTYLYEDNPAKALEETEAAIEWAERESLPEYAATLYQVKALINLEQNNFEEAEKAMAACNEIIESHELTDNRKQMLEEYALRNKVIQYAKSEDFDKADEKVETMRLRAEESGNNNDKKMYHMLTGIIAYEKGNFDEAIQALKKSDTKNAYGQFYLAQSYQKSGRNAEARKLFDKVAKWNEHSVEYALVRNKALAASKMDMAVEE